MAIIYILRGASGRHYIGMTGNLERRLEQHRSGHTHTTRRLGGSLEVVASHKFSDRASAAIVERELKNWKNPQKAIAHLSALNP
jgi:putative endonuclease